MSWYTSSWQHMHRVLQQALGAGHTGAELTKAIDGSYPYGQRSGWPYKAWLSARKDFCRLHSLPLRRAPKPGADDLFQEGH